MARRHVTLIPETGRPSVLDLRTIEDLLSLLERAATVETVSLVLTTGAVCLGVACALWAARAAVHARAREQRWRRRLLALEARHRREEMLEQAEVDAVFIWTGALWRETSRLYDEEPGSTAEAQAALARIPMPARALGTVHATLFPDGEAPPADCEDAGALFHAFLRRLTGESLTRFVSVLGPLFYRGVNCTAILTTADGRELELYGRPAGAQAVLRIREVTAERREIARLHEALRATEEKMAGLAEIIDAAPVPLWRRGADGRLAIVNRAYAAAVGADDPHEVTGRGIEIDPGLRAIAQDARRLGTPQIARRHAVMAGARVAIDVHETPLGEGTVGAAIDVTQAESFERTLNRHIDAHQQTLDRLNTPVAIFGPDRRLMFHNEAFQKLWGLDAGWLAEKPEHGALLDRLREAQRLPEQPDYAAWKRDRLQMYSDITDDSEEMWHLPDGATIRVITRHHPLGGLITVYEDMSAMVAMESRHNTLIGVQRATLNNLQEGVAVFGSDGRLRLFNASFVRQWAIDPAELDGEPHIDDITPLIAGRLDEAAGWAKMVAAVTAASDERDSEETMLNCADGAMIEVAAQPLPDGATLLLFVDVTAAFNMERALRERNAALEAADRLKSEFISNVSYQLRTPLNAVVGFTEMMREGIAGDLNDKQREYTGNIFTAAKDLEHLIDDIIDLAAIEAGKLRLEPGTVDIAALLASVQGLMARRATESAVSIELSHAPDIGTIVADERRLKQALLNLATNALHFNREGGRIVIGAERIDGAVRLWVEDTGSGIAPEDQARVFDRFQNRGGQGKRGAGLGLTLVNSFIELHGGWVALESEPGKGTRVICTLPEMPADAGDSAVA